MSVTRNIRLLALHNFLEDFTPYSVIAVIYFAQVSGSYARGMSVLGAVMLFSALLEVPTGIVSDLLGRRRTIIAGSAARLLAVTAYALAGSYEALLVGSFFSGLGTSLFSGNNSALLYDTLSELSQRERYQEYLGKTSSMFQVALAGSAVLGGLLAAESFSLVMWVSVLPKLVMVVVSLRFIEPHVHGDLDTNAFAHLREAIRAFVRNPRLRYFSVGSMWGFGLGEATFQFRVVFIEMLWPLWMIGIARLVSHVMAAISFYFAGPLIKRFGEARLLIGGITLAETTTLTALLVPSVLSPLFMGFTSIFFGVNTVSLNGLMQREFTNEQRSTMGSLNALGGSLLFAVMSVLLGALADRIGVTNALIVATMGLFISPPLFLLAFRRTVPESARQAVMLDASAD